MSDLILADQPVAEMRQGGQGGLALGYDQVKGPLAGPAVRIEHRQGALVQLPLNQKGRDQRHAQPVAGRLGQHGKQFQTHAGHGGGRGDAGRGEPFAPGRRPGALLQQRQGGDVGRVQRAGGQAGTADRHGILPHQEMGLGARPARIARIDGGVELRVFEQERMGAGGHVDLQARPFGAQRRQARQQPAGGEGRHHGQFQDAAALVGHDRLGVPFERIQLPAHQPAVAFPRVGQAHAPTRALEQRHADQGFQRRDLPADRALGQGQFLGGAGEAFVPRGGLEGLQGLGAGQSFAHVRSDKNSLITQFISFVWEGISR